jgi:imidazolonepropionase-like amidohydrolase
MGSIALIRQTFLDTDWYQKARAALALNPNQEMPEYNRACEAIAEAVNSNEPFIFETGDKLSLLRANRVAKEFGRTLINVGYGDEYQRINEIAADKQILIVPLNYPETPQVGSYEDQLDVSLGALRHWELAPSNPATLEKNKIEFAFTTYRLDKKENFLENLRKAIKRGLSRETALAALTSVPARICGISDVAGTLSQGKIANLFITDKDIFDKEATIYSVWVAGNKKELKPFPEYDFTGSYSLNLDGVPLNLEISGKPDKPSGNLSAGEKKFDLNSVELQGAKLLFSAKIDTLGLDGIFRFSGRKAEKNFEGKVTRPDGTRLDFAASPAEKKEESKDSINTDSKEGEAKNDKESDEPETLISKLTYPNIAFGFEALPKTQDVLIRNATVWTGEKEGILQNTDVLVVGGKIAAVGKTLTAPKSGNVIDATGKHVTAGIIDEHSHIAINGGVNECSDAITCEVRIGDVVDCDDNSIYRQLAGGTTAAQLLHGSCNPMGGQAQVIKLRWGANAEEMKFAGVAPTVKFALGENVKQSNWGDNYSVRYPQTRMGVETIIKDEFQAAREYDAEWASYNAMSSGNKRKTVPPRRDLELDAASDIINSRLFIHCHSYQQSEILMLMRLTEQFGCHVQTFTHILEGYKLAPEMAQHGATASGFADWWAYKFEVYDAIPYNSALMASAGIVTSINSDSDDLGRRLNQEAGKAVMYGGMSQEEAIKLATLNPAIQLKIDNRVGSIKVGKDADFVIWNDHPLSIYAKPVQTWIDGKKYFDIKDDAAMRMAVQTEKEALVQKILARSDGKKKGEGKWGERTNIRKYEWHCDDNTDFWKAVQE